MKHKHKFDRPELNQILANTFVDALRERGEIITGNVEIGVTAAIVDGSLSVTVVILTDEDVGPKITVDGVPTIDFPEAPEGTTH